MSDASIGAIILSPMIFCFLLLYASLKMGEDHAALKYFFLLFIPPSFWASLHLASISIAEFHATWTNGIETMAFYVQLSGWIMGIMTAYLFIFFIYTAFTSMAEKKKKRSEGLDYGEE